MSCPTDCAAAGYIQTLGGQGKEESLDRSYHKKRSFLINTYKRYR